VVRSVEWQSADLLGHYSNHSHPRVVDRECPRMDKRIAPYKEGVMDKQCLGEGKLLFQTDADRGCLVISGKSIRKLQSQTWQTVCHLDVYLTSQSRPILVYKDII